MNNRSLLPVFLAPTALLLIPLAGNMFVDGWVWNAGSFVFAWAMMVGVGLAYRFVTRKAGSVAYRLATGIALMAGFMIVWGNLAVGFIGSEDNPANLLYGTALAVAAIGAVLARFEASGMSRAMFATALAVFLVPVVALVVRPGDFDPGVAQVFGLNFFFVLMFAGAGLLFRLAARKRDNRDAQAAA
jgi:hypothetical protein